jgi:hypothetical protein
MVLPIDSAASAERPGSARRRFDIWFVCTWKSLCTFKEEYSVGSFDSSGRTIDLGVRACKSQPYDNCVTLSRAQYLILDIQNRVDVHGVVVW